MNVGKVFFPFFVCAMSEPIEDSWEEEINPRKHIDYARLQVPTNISPGEYLGGDLLDPEKFPVISTPPKERVNAGGIDSTSDGDLTPVYQTGTPSPNQARAPEKREVTGAEMQAIIDAQTESKGEPLGKSAAIANKEMSEGGAPSSTESRA